MLLKSERLAQILCRLGAYFACVFGVLWPVLGVCGMADLLDAG
jgi:hypothetical protein